MKFHKQVKIPGMTMEQIVEALEQSELEMRPMRAEYSFVTMLFKHQPLISLQQILLLFFLLLF